MITLKQINKEYVKAIPIPSALDKRPVRGGSVCSEVYSNIFLCAKKKSGKTSCTFTIMKRCCDKRTHIIIFSSTLFKDENWLEIVAYFKSKGNPMELFTSIYEDGEDQLAKIVNELGQEAKEESLDEPVSEVERCDDLLERLTQMHLVASGRQTQEQRQEQEQIEHEEKKKVKKSKYKTQE